MFTTGDRLTLKAILSYQAVNHQLLRALLFTDRRIMANVQEVQTELSNLDSLLQQVSDQEAAESTVDLQPLVDHIKAEQAKVQSLLDAQGTTAPAPTDTTPGAVNTGVPTDTSSQAPQ